MGFSLDDQSRDVIVRTLLGEAMGEGPEGMRAVAHVIANRASDPRWPDSPADVALQPMQFSAWNSGAGGNDLVRKYGPDTPEYQLAAALTDDVFAGFSPDLTEGATHYYSPAGMDALVEQGAQSNRVPTWFEEERQKRGGDVTIGGHIFTGKAEGTSMSGLREVTDPDILAAFDAPPEGGRLKEVTDPNILAAFEQSGPGYAGAKPGEVEVSELPPPGLRPELVNQINTAIEQGGETSMGRHGQGMMDAATDIALGGFYDEAEGALSGVVLGRNPETGAWFDYSRPMEERYAAVRDAVRGQVRDYAEKHPVASTAAGVVGGVGTALAAPVGAVTRAASMGGQMARGAGIGAAYGGAYGFGSGEGGFDERVQNMPGGAISGAMGGAVGVPLGHAVGWLGRAFGKGAARILGRKGAFDPTSGTVSAEAKAALLKEGVNPDEVTEEYLKAFAKRAQDLPPDQAARAAALEAVGTRGTRGQISGQVTQQGAEESLRAGARGEGGAQIMKEFDNAQQGALSAYRQGLGENMAPKMGTAADPTDAAEMALAGVSREAQRSKAMAQAFYRKSEEAGAVIRKEAFDVLRSSIDERLAGQQIFVDSATPSAQRVLRLIDARSKLKTVTSDGGRVVGASLKAFDETRKMAGKALRDAERAGNTFDAQALGEIVGAMDDWVDDAVETALLSGDPAALESLKAARRLWAKYWSQFMGRKGADNFIRKMVEEETNPRDVVGWLFGATKMGSNRNSLGIVKRLKGILGEDSAEWGAIRQGAWARLTTATEGRTQPGAQKQAENVIEFLKGPNRALAAELFSPAEMRQMLTYTRALQTTLTKAKAANPSGTSYSLQRRLNELLRGVATLFGASVGGPGGAVAGNVAIGLSQGFTGRLAAKAATAGIPIARNVAPSAVGGAVAAQDGRKVVASQ